MNIIKNLNSIAKNVLINEAEALKKIADYLDEGFEACVKYILNNPGRVVVTGIGKSAHVANKLVATLNSTGQPALFMHAADAIHGDLGMIQRDDVVIAISKSGNTPEIKVLVPLLKRRGSKLIALVSNTDSYLARQADFIMNATIDKEACPNNLAPTTSTTAHMALGDALAVCLLKARGFSSRDFASFHPGGALGKQLYLKVDDIFIQHECPIVQHDTPLNKVIFEISSKRLGVTTVVNEKNELLGIITDGDLRRMLEKYENLSGLMAADVMTASPKVIEKGAYAVKAADMMQEYNITQVVVVNQQQQVAGIVHLHDLMKEGIL